MARPFALCRSILSASVFVPRRTSHASNGPRIAPSAFCTNFSHSMSSSRVATTTPPTLSLWPLRYFVVLCTTRSAPNSIGRWMYGLAKVLSTTSRRSWRCASAAAAARSVRRMTGLVGVSTNSMRVAEVIACSTSSRFAVSTYEKEMAARVSTLSKSRNVPPYVLSETMTWSPALSIVAIAPIAAMPDAKANPALPPSIAAMLRSSAKRVGFCVRAYS